MYLCEDLIFTTLSAVLGVFLAKGKAKARERQREGEVLMVVREGGEAEAERADELSS